MYCIPSILATAFRKEDETMLQFASELRKLTGSERLELAQQVAHAMGLRQDEVSFSL
jgi:hypothetical protein